MNGGDGGSRGEGCVCFLSSSALGPAQNLGDHSSSLLGCTGLPSVLAPNSHLGLRAAPGLAQEVWGSWSSGKTKGSASPLLGVRFMDTLDLSLSSGPERERSFPRITQQLSVRTATRT